MARMSISKSIHRINAGTTIPDSVAKMLAALLVAVFGVESAIRPLAGYFEVELTRPLVMAVFAASFALFFARTIRRQIRRAMPSKTDA